MSFCSYILLVSLGNHCPFNWQRPFKHKALDFSSRMEDVGGNGCVCPTPRVCGTNTKGFTGGSQAQLPGQMQWRVWCQGRPLGCRIGITLSILLCSSLFFL